MSQMWVSNTVSSPSSGAVIVDMGATANDANWYFAVILNATLAADFRLQHRDSTNSSNVNEQQLNILANNASPLGQYNIFLAAGERIRIVMGSALTLGSVSCSLFYGQ